MRNIAVMTLISLTIALPAAAQTPGLPSPHRLSAVYSCADIQIASERLACYDSAVVNLRDAEAQGDIVAFDRQQAADIQRESFGFNLPSLSALIPRLEESEESERQMQITRIVRAPNGYYQFVMEGGQTWTQSERQRTGNVRVGDTVTVRQGLFGSFLMSSPRGGAPHRVRRTS